MSLWTIPYVDQGLDFWQEIEGRFGQQVREVYFPTPGGRFASGRGPQPQRFLEDMLRHTRLAKSVLVNPIILPQPVEAMAPGILACLRWLRDEFGVGSVTVASLGLARLIRDELPDLTVIASVLMGIATPAQALLVRDSVHGITVDNRLLRDLAGLKRLRSAFPGEMRLIVNEACIAGCPYRAQHFYEMGYGDGSPRSLCQAMLDDRPWLRLTGAWILPRHLGFYDGLYDGLKLAGRVTLRDRNRYLSVLGAYVQRGPILPRDIGGGPASPLEPIDVSDEWFETVLHCDKRCDVCSVCREQYEQAPRRAGGQ
jgi:hypothetical protein